jgi:hypothetical protein
MTQTSEAPAATEEQRTNDWREFLQKKAGTVGSARSAPSTFLDHTLLDDKPENPSILAICSQRELGWALGAQATPAGGATWGEAKPGRAIAQVCANLSMQGIGEQFLPTAIRVSHVGRIYLTGELVEGSARAFSVYKCYEQGLGQMSQAVRRMPLRRLVPTSTRSGAAEQAPSTAMGPLTAP